MGKTVVVVAPETHLGGLTSGGLGWTDSGQKEAVGGLAREVYRRIKAHYDRPDAWRQQKPEQYRLYRKDDDAIWAFEPHVAERAFEDLVAEAQDPGRPRRVARPRRTGSRRTGTKIVAIRTLERQDATAAGSSSTPPMKAT